MRSKRLFEAENDRVVFTLLFSNDYTAPFRGHFVGGVCVCMCECVCVFVCTRPRAPPPDNLREVGRIHTFHLNTTVTLKISRFSELI